ncbi:MAG TPA: hypothetical protein VGC55_17115 [Dokdonella sp.]
MIDSILRRRASARVHRAFLLFVWVLFATVAIDAGAAELTVAHTGDPATPASVPDGYVVTPNGYFHPSCVHHIEAGQRVHMQGGIENADHRMQTTRACAYAHFDARGNRIEASRGAGTPAGTVGTERFVRGDTIFTGTFDFYDGYIESLTHRVVVAQSLQSMEAFFTVPASPTRHGDQTVYLFPGLEYYEHVQTILQPVLGWNAFGDNAWTLTSWNCCVDGSTNYAGPISIEPGDEIDGTMTGSDCDASTHVCANWIVAARNASSNQAATLNTVGHSQAFDWLFAGALEVYSLSTCDQLPAGRSVRFSAIDATTVAQGALIDLPWGAGNPGTLVACDYHMTVNSPGAHAGDVTLYY